MRKIIFLMLSLLILSAASVNVHAQVTIGSTDNPDVDAVLDLNSADKGLLIPRINLTTTLTGAQKAGLVVYNTGSNASFTPGFYYNDGANWIKIGSGTGTLTGITQGTGIAVSGSAPTLTVGIADGGVNNAQLANNAVDSFKIKDLSISGANIADRTIDPTKIKSQISDSGYFLMSDGSGARFASRFGGTIESGWTVAAPTFADVTWQCVLDQAMIIPLVANTRTHIIANDIMYGDMCYVNSSAGMLHAWGNDGYIVIVSLGGSTGSATARLRCFRPSF